MRPIICLFGVLCVCNDVPAAESADVSLPPIIVSARRTQISPGELSENVVVLDQEDITLLPAGNAAETFKYVPGVDIDVQRGFGRATSVSIQGSDSRHVRIMIDGIPFNTQSSGQVNPSQFPIESIERIEIIKGSASHLWGSGLGGVINIVTKSTGTRAVPEGSVSASAAEFSTQKQSGELAGKYRGLGYYGMFSYLDSGGTGPVDDVREKKGLMKLSFESESAGQLTAMYGYSGADIKSGVFPDGTYQSQPYRTRYGKIGWQRGLGDVELQADFKTSRQEILTRTFLSADSRDPTIEVQSKDRLNQLSLVAVVYPDEQSRIAAGSDFDWDTLKSNLYLAKAKNLNTQAPFVSYTRHFGSLDLHMALRYDRNSEFGEELSPSLGGVYLLPVLRKARLSARLARSFNAPPLLWKFNHAPLLGVAPNPDIGAERAWTCEAGFENEWHEGWSTKISWYFAEVKDALARAQDDAGLVFMKNFRKFRRQGVELAGSFRLNEMVTLFASAAFNDIEDRTTGETVQGGARPRQRYEGGVDFTGGRGLKVLLYVYYYYWNESPSSDPNDRKLLADIRISQQIKYLTVFLNVYNLADSKYWRDIFFPSSRRYVEGGVTMRW